MAAQLYSFLHNLSEEARGRDNMVLAVSIPASELEKVASNYQPFSSLYGEYSNPYRSYFDPYRAWWYTIYLRFMENAGAP